MAKRKLKCKWGRLKSPIRNPRTKVLRVCKLKPKTARGKLLDRRKRSKEAHEIIYRRRKRR